MPAKTAATPTFCFCPNCGQELSKEDAKAAANPVVKFCSQCGFRLASNGTCKNPDCEFFGKVPPMA